MAKQKSGRLKGKSSGKKPSEEELLERRKHRRQSRLQKRRLRRQRRAEEKLLIGKHYNPKRPKEERSRLREIEPPERPNQIIYCRWCEEQTSHTISDFCGSLMKLCTKCGEMRHPQIDAKPKKKPRQQAA
ncbi:hypothetical protein A2480_03195 [Candidatus Uhrbacteria bacterium RIFOXYC2_FULL_47_19]|uniref:Uncharacterized protein n=1 Tax=Candidatus Uhrbacteria bacterium RIFOXYC2_FULL_47_19 TaxID=1802424 RepID=A0A1F7WDV6_9BACT|nr:MAG: hypothetical protein A2480_03195 [Candidatus Uhrbacteria bacterium RIFOXYC2_FULL_47_19]HCC21870.1 hypothetical protein [Candidatus Uhrbacteria bacterium]